MEPGKFIEKFLGRVRKKRARVFILKGFYLVLAFLTGGFFLVNLLSYYYAGPVREFRTPLLILFAAGFAYLLYHCFLRGETTSFSIDQAALLTEKKYPELANSLINASQLKRRLSRPDVNREFSVSFIKEQIRRTRLLVEKIEPESIIDSGQGVRNRNWLLGMIISLLLAAFLLPGFLIKGFDNLTSPPVSAASLIQAGANEPAPGTAASLDRYSVSDLKLTFNYPAYARMKSEVIHPSDGEIEVLPGTEVQVEAAVNLPVAGGELVWNARDNFSMRVLGNRTLMSQFLVKERGSYQFRVKDPEGTKRLLPKKYAVALAQDQTPIIVLFIANPKPVYFANEKIELFYEARDDFGVEEIDLVAFVNGKQVRESVKRIKNGEREIRGSHSWALAGMEFEADDKVEYFLEIKDNDNIQGPNTGQSEMFSFTIFDSRRERENLIDLQEELTEKMIAQLASGLIVGAESKAVPIDAAGWKRHLIASADSLIEIIGLAQRIEDRAATLEYFPRPYFNLLQNIIRGLNRIRDEQIEAINKTQDTVHKITPIAYEVMDLDSLNQRLVSRLETGVLFLVRMTNRQKLDQVMDLERRLNELTRSLKEEFEKIRDKKAPLKSSELKRKINRIRETLEKIMDQLARQTGSLPDEFLNPDSFKGMNMDQFSASLDRIMDLMDRGKIDAAEDELNKMAGDLQTMVNRLDQARSEMDDLMNLKIMKQLDDSLEKLKRLEKDQEKLLDQTIKVNQSLHEAQSRLFENSIRGMFAEIKNLLDEIQGVLNGDGQFMDAHPAMKTLDELMGKEAKVNRKLRSLSQKTVDSSRSPALESNFLELNDVRRERARLMTEIDSLRVKVFHEFQNALPRLLEKYDALEDLTESYDLNEFNNLFKNTYPEVFQWRNNIRVALNIRKDLGDRLNEDLRQVTRLNGEISKKLGSMMRAIQDSGQSLLSNEDKAELQKMAREEQRLQEESEKLAQRFGRMNKQNPTITPELAAKTSRAGRNMLRAQSSLDRNQVQKSVDAENKALKELQETREMIREIKEANSQGGKRASRSTALQFGSGWSRDSRRGGSVRMKKEKVQLPSEDQYKPPGEFREEILRAMKKHTPKSYRRMVMEYYKELVK